MRSLVFYAIFSMMMVCFGLDLQAVETIVNVNKGVMKPTSIAVNVINKENVLSGQVTQVVCNDLESSGLFKIIPEEAFMQQLNNVEEALNYTLWKTINAQYVINIEINILEDNMIEMVGRLHDVLYGKPVLSIRIACKLSEFRRGAHVISNNVYCKITGKVGHFDTQLLFVDIKKNKREKKYRLAIMDQDSYNLKFLTKGNSLILTPRFSPDGKECTFFAFKEKIVNKRRIPLTAKIYRYNFATKNAKVVSKLKGMTYAPRYSPDGNSLIFSLSKRGNSWIHTIDLSTGRVTQLTHGPYIDTSPCYSPDGKYIVFNSDRSLTQQLYIMNADGSEIRRLIDLKLQNKRYRYATPVWSPDGEWIAFTRFGGGSFYIGVVRPDGTGERMVAASGNVIEGPTWSANGSTIMFSQRDYAGRDSIMSVNITGYNHRTVKTANEAIDPDWSKRYVSCDGL